MMENIIGRLCKSKAGHDSGFYYIIVGIENNRYELCDGKYKLLAGPKLKNKNHVELINFTDEDLQNKIMNKKLRDEDIYHSIRKFKKSVNNDIQN